jgi:hypothetical protein
MPLRHYHGTRKATTRSMLSWWCMVCARIVRNVRTRLPLAQLLSGAKQLATFHVTAVATPPLPANSPPESRPAAYSGDRYVYCCAIPSSTLNRTFTRRATSGRRRDSSQSYKNLHLPTSAAHFSRAHQTTAKTSPRHLTPSGLLSASSSHSASSKPLPVTATVSRLTYSTENPSRLSQTWRPSSKS